MSGGFGRREMKTGRKPRVRKNPPPSGGARLVPDNPALCACGMVAVQCRCEPVTLQSGGES